MASYLPRDGFEWNPLRAYRNVACYCGSGRKSKWCHGIFDTVDANTAKHIKAYLRALSMQGFIEAHPGDLN